MDTGRDAHGVRSLNRHTLEQIVAASSAAVLVLDARDARLPVVYASPAYERLTGAVATQLAGRTWPLLERGDAAELRALLEKRTAGLVTLTDARGDGTPLPSEVAVTPLHDTHGDVRFLLCNQRATAQVFASSDTASPATSAVPQSIETTGEVAQLQPEIARSRQKAPSHDRVESATGLLKFSYFQDTLRRDLAIARRDRRYVTLLVFEIVEFDIYRRTFGDKAADSCQRMIGAQIMRTLRRAGDMCARYDDTTLVAAVLGQTPDDIRPLAEQIADNVRQLKLHNPRAKTSRSVSVRVDMHACPPGAHDDPEPVIARLLEESRGNDARLRAAHA
jgi:diguanylate cyclase (GGDEF)-like protein/PAS domain S-box-containing protein